MNFDKKRYDYLQARRDQGLMTPAEKEELIAMCADKLYALMQEHKQMFVRMKNR